MLKDELEERQSVLIEAMRFPLIVLVVFIHILPGYLVPLHFDLSGMNVYHVISEILSHSIGRMAVPCFFLFSGFFFFRKLEVWSSRFYFTQLRKRVMTLLLPYFLWNMVMIMTICIKQYIFSLLSLESKEDGIFDIHNQSWFELFWLGPVNFPLWYLRDLICMSLLAPAFYYIFRYLKIWGLLLLVILYLTTLSIPVKGMSMTALLFFGIGAYCGIYKENLLRICLKLKKVCAIGALFFLCCATYNHGGVLYELFIRPFILFGMVTAINLMNSVINRPFWKKRLCSLSATVFFIYAVHEIYIINWTKGFFSRTSLIETTGGLMLAYILIPIITVTVCLLLYFLLNNTVPRLLAFTIGGRASTKLSGGK